MKKFFALLVLFFFLLLPTCSAKILEFEATGSYRMGESDTMIDAKERAKQLALREIVQKAGVAIIFSNYSEKFCLV